MKLSFRTRIILLTVLAVVVPVLFIQILTVTMQSNVGKEAENELNQLAKLNIEQIARDAYSICETSNEMMIIKNNVSLNLLKQKIADRGGINFSNELVQWSAKNQFTSINKEVSLPKMMVGTSWFGKNQSFDIPSLIVDDITKSAGGTVTIFQKMNQNGDMIRIATSVPNVEGKRAISTYIPAVNPDGMPNQVITKVLSGQPYHGIAFVVNDWYVSTYEPMFDKNKNIIGMLYVGERLNKIQTLRKALMNIRVGKSGYIYVIGTVEPHKGRYIISKDGKRDGENILEATDETGKKVIRDIVNQAVTMKGNDVLSYDYGWRNPDDSTTRRKIAAVTYFKPWGWVIGAGTYEDDYYDARDRINLIIQKLRFNLYLAGVLILVVIIIIASFISDRMTRPLGFVTGIAKKISEGNIFDTKDLITKYRQKYKLPDTDKNYIKDDAVKLLLSFEEMVSKLDSLIGQVQKSGIQVSTTVTQIAASARELEATVAEQSSSTREVTATSNLINNNAKNLAVSIHNVSDRVNETAVIAEAGKSNITLMENAMYDLAKATISITSKLSIINERANKISAVVTTINKISDHTNLLSLNAAIEAEKAGEYGKGFSVVAREISRLADQTAVATKDIEKMVNEMQSSVSSGVMEMDKFGQEVKRNTEDVSKVGENLNTIINKVKNLIPDFENVSSNAVNQSESASQITEAMSQLSQAAIQTKDSLTEFKKASSMLTEALAGLQSEVSKFKLN